MLRSCSCGERSQLQDKCWEPYMYNITTCFHLVTQVLASANVVISTVSNQSESVPLRNTHALCVSFDTFNFFPGHPYLWCTTLHHYIGYCRLLAECSCSKYEWLQETHMASIVNALWSFHTTPLESHLTFFYIAILDTIFLIIYCLMQNEVFRKLPCIQCKTTLLPSTAKLGKCIPVCRYI